MYFLAYSSYGGLIYINVVTTIGSVSQGLKCFLVTDKYILLWESEK